MSVIKGSQSASSMRNPLRAAHILASNASNEVVKQVIGSMRRGKVYMAVARDRLVHDLIRMLMLK